MPAAWFALGVAVAALIVAVMALFRTRTERAAKVVMDAADTVSRHGVRRQGKIFMPLDDADEGREEIIRRNKELGRATPIDELREK